MSFRFFPLTSTANVKILAGPVGRVASVRLGQTRHRRFSALLVAASIAGCSIARAPIKTPPQIVATPQPGELNVSFAPSPLVGDVQPVYLSIANGTDTPRSVVPSQIFALNEAADRVAPIPAGEAARQAGGSR